MTKVNVGPKIKNPTHDLALEGDNFLWGLKLDGGVRGMQENSQSPSTMLIGSGGKRFGTGDPTFTEIEQSSWHGGRGSEFFSDDETRYFVGWNAMTRIPGKLIPQLLWKFADGHRDIDQNIPGSVSWHQLRGSERYISVSFVAGSSYNADLALVWLRRRGSPGTLTIELCSDSAGDPGSVLKTVTKTVSDITDTPAFLLSVDWTTTQALVSGTTYHLKVYGASADSAANHWEIGVDESGSSSKTSSDNSAWTAASFSVYYRIVDTDTASMSGRYHFFVLNGTQLFMITQPASGNSALYEWDETNDIWVARAMDAGDALSGIVKSVAISKNIAHCARGTGGGDETIWTFNSVSGTETGQDDATGANKADHLLAYNDPVDGPQIARFENDNWYWSRSAVKALNTDLVFGTDVTFPQGFDALSMAFYNDQAWVRTTDGIHSVKNDRPSRLDVGLDAVLEPSTALAPLLAKDLFLYIAWSYSLERLYGGTLDDIGLWKGTGLYATRQGVVSALCGGIGGVYVAIDAGTAGVSGVFFTTNGRDYEEVFRGWVAGQRIRSLFYQAQNGTTSPARLWIGVGESVVYIDLPDQSMNPLHDTGSRFCWEYSIISSTHDFGAMHLPKFFRGIEVSADNLGAECDVGVDYQIDKDVGTNTWVELTTLYQSPHDVADLNLGNRKKIRYRLRASTSNSATPPAVNAVVVTGFARTKLKRQWNLRVKAADLQRTRTGGKDHSWSSFYAFIQEGAKQADDFVLRSPEVELDGLHVVMDAPTVFRKFVNTIQKWVGGSFALTLREA